jgi:hypothetical protein
MTCTCTGPPINEIDPECPEHKGCCRTCGCPEDQMPMVFRGTGWCSENHHKQQQEDDDAEREHEGGS